MLRKVLVVDDELAIQLSIKLMLEKREYEVELAGDGKTAIEVYNSFLPDITLMDIKMPIMDGILASNAILRINPNARIIMLTAYGDIEYRSDAYKVGATMFISKPIEMNDLLEALDTALC